MVGIYRDDGLAVAKGSGPELSSLEKNLIRLFKQEDLSITVETNIRKTDYLDVAFDLQNDLHKPFRKENDSPLYINIHSNHPPTIIKQIPKNIEKRLSYLSSNKAIFEEQKPIYEEALRKSGYKSKLEYQETPNIKPKRVRRRKIIWFNPPFSLNVKTDLGAKFIALIIKHFPKGSKLNKYFNRSTIKLSYSTTSNVKRHIDKHNSRALSDNEVQNQERTCDCKNLQVIPCPLNGECLQKSVVYQADIKHDNIVRTYYGMTKNKFKTRYNQPNSSLNNEDYRSATKLSSYAWKLKDKNKAYSIDWSIKATGVPYQPGSKICDLCLVEKTVIALADPQTTLNSRNEILFKCKHKINFSLSKF